MSVYFAELDGLIKIGYSASPSQRARSLKARLLAVMPGGRRMERVMHGIFEEYRSHGEWFHPGTRLVVFMEALNSDSTRFELPGDDYRLAESNRKMAAFHATAAAS